MAGCCMGMLVVVGSDARGRDSCGHSEAACAHAKLASCAHAELRACAHTELHAFAHACAVQRSNPCRRHAQSRTPQSNVSHAAGKGMTAL